MADHHDQVEALLSKGTMNWTRAAAAFASKALRVADGGTPDARAAEETWKRFNALRQERAGTAAKGRDAAAVSDGTRDRRQRDFDRKSSTPPDSHMAAMPANALF